MALFVFAIRLKAVSQMHSRGRSFSSDIENRQDWALAVKFQ
jgi:hypothetical protein